MINRYTALAKITLALIYLVILAGSVVRMTGSGMGCPDWPKCFGYALPPTQESTLEWQSEREFKKGQVIILEEQLKVAKKDFTTASEFNPSNWSDYDKHNYAEFNVWHTWIEFINRLLGALAGLFTLLLLFFAFAIKPIRTKYVVYSLFLVLGMGFQAWLGAKVVYSVLNPFRISLHMGMALLIVAVLLRFIHDLNHPVKGELFQPKLRNMVGLALLLSLVQIAMGTQVREFVDLQVDLFGYDKKSKWLEDPTLLFYVHRSFSILVLGLNLYIAYILKNTTPKVNAFNWVIVFLGLEIATGIAMYYFDFPWASQPLHLIIATFIFGFQYYGYVRISKNLNRVK